MSELPFRDHGEDDFAECPKMTNDPGQQCLYETFFIAMKALQRMQAANMARAGFQDHIANELYFPTKLALVMTEIAEAIEAHRNGDRMDDHLPMYRGMDVEMADAVIRIMTICAERGVNLAELVAAKMEYNKKRPVRHGGKSY